MSNCLFVETVSLSFFGYITIQELCRIGEDQCGNIVVVFQPYLYCPVNIRAHMTTNHSFIFLRLFFFF